MEVKIPNSNYEAFELSCFFFLTKRGRRTCDCQLPSKRRHDEEIRGMEIGLSRIFGHLIGSCGSTPVPTCWFMLPFPSLILSPKAYLGHPRCLQARMRWENSLVHAHAGRVPGPQLAG